MTIGAKVKQTLSSLKSTNTSLEIYAVHSHNHQAQLAFQESINMLNTVIEDLEERVQKLEFEEPQYKGL